MSKLACGCLHIHPPLSPEESATIEQLSTTLSDLSVTKITNDQAALILFPEYDESGTTPSITQLCKTLRAMHKSVYLSLYLWSNDGAERWLAFDDELDHAYFDEGNIPYTVLPWINGDNPSNLRENHPAYRDLYGFQRLVFAVLRVKQQLAVQPTSEVAEATRALAAQIPDSWNASGLMDEFFWLAVNDTEAYDSKPHWSHWRYQAGLLAFHLVVLCNQLNAKRYKDDPYHDFKERDRYLLGDIDPESLTALQPQLDALLALSTELKLSLDKRLFFWKGEPFFSDNEDE